MDFLNLLGFGGEMVKEIPVWLDWLALKVSARTVEGYRWEVQHLATWGSECGLQSARSFRSSDLTRYLAERRDAGIGPSAIKRAIAAFRSFFAFTVGASKSPARNIPYPKVPRRVQRTLTVEEASQVLASFDTSTTTGARDLALFAFMIDSGLRASEVCRVQLSDLRLDDRTALVVVKGGQQRFGIFSEYTAHLLASWLAVRSGVALESETALFVSVGGLKPGTALTRDGLKCLYRRVAFRSGVGMFSPHALRRSFATLSTVFHAPSRSVQQAGGWGDIRQVERYTQALDPRAFDPYFPMPNLVSSGPVGSHAP